MSSLRHLSCLGCRIRVRASAPEIDLLEGGCPVCGAMLTPVSSSSVIGFRSFDLSELSKQESDDPPKALGNPVAHLARRESASAPDDLDADRWSDDGGLVDSVAVAKWPASH